MAADFFGLVRQSKSRIAKLGLMLILPVGISIFAVFCLIYFFWYQVEEPGGYDAQSKIPEGDIAIVSAGLTLFYFGVMMFIKFREFAPGGSVLAYKMYAEPLCGKPRDWREEQLLNIVEEMSLAAGIP